LKTIDRGTPPVKARRTLERARGLLSERERKDATRLQYGRLAGVLFTVGALAYLLAALEVKDSDRLAVYIVTAAVICSGVICSALPWRRLPDASLHVLVIIADLEVGVAVWATDPVTGAFFILVGVFAAYAVESRRQIVAHLVFIGLLFFAPLLYDAAAHAQTVRHALLFLPITLLAAGMVTYLRERTEKQERRLRTFAAEAIDVAARLLGDGEIAEEDKDRDGQISTQLQGDPIPFG
jgi:uncharacterized membrane protein